MTEPMEIGFRQQMCHNSVLCEFCGLCLRSCVFMDSAVGKNLPRCDLQCVCWDIKPCSIYLSINAVGCLVDGRDRGDRESSQ